MRGAGRPQQGPTRGKRRRQTTIPVGAFFVAVVALAVALCALGAYHVFSNVDREESHLGRALRKSMTGAAGAAGSTDKNGGARQVLVVPSDKCQAEYDRVNVDRTPGLSTESIQRSRAWIGNRQRLDNLARNLTSGSDVHVVTFGGSVTLGHGVEKNTTEGYVSGPYGDLLEGWLNKMYGGGDEAGSDGEQQQRHKVFNMAAHGADICALEKRINGILSDLDRKGAHPDLFLLEFAVNDYQGQDHIIQVDSKTDVFFHGFQDIALCCEVVINKLLRTFPQATIAFLEFRTGITSRKTGAFLHSGVAQHYEIPVISYAEAMFPEYFRLLSMLNASDRYTVPKGETLMPYPYGCHPCNPNGIATSFNHFRPPDKHCRTVCDLIFYSGQECDMFKSPPPGREYCHPPIFAVDAVHPSTVGHGIAKDLIAHAISGAVRDRCRNEPYAKNVLPTTGWLGSPSSLKARADFVDIRDTDCFLPFCKKLQPTHKTDGFTYYSDVKATNFEKFGWIATNPVGNETIEFDVDLPHRPCYAIYVAVLRSYAGMGQFTVEVENKEDRREKTTVELDGLWKPHISVWSDNQITMDTAKGACTGRCKVLVRTKPQVAGRDGNKVKILTLSARECSGS